MDVGVLTITLLLTFIGLAALFSFSMNADAANRLTFYRQLGFIAAGLILALYLMTLDYRLFGGLHWVLYGVGNALLVGVLLFGQTVRGTTGWFSFGFVQLQPVEVMKVILAIVLAKIMSDQRAVAQSWMFIFRTGVVVAVPVVLVMVQPDFGSAIVMLGMWGMMLLVSPTPRRYLFILLGIAAVVGALSWATVLKPYQKKRIITFVQPASDPQGAGYNVRQALAAIGSGQLFGRGLGLGPQSQLEFLPERQTDFIFASISEELGFLGGGTVIILFGFYFLRLVRLFGRAVDGFTGYLIIGLGGVIFIHVLVNIGMNLGVLPVTGIPLPYVSYGGSSLLGGFLSLGILESISIRLSSRLSA